MKDLFGMAILDFQTNNSPEDLITETNISEPDIMSVLNLFRGYDTMPAIEKRALDLVKGNVLDVGCGAGSHSLYMQNILNLNVTSIDISPAAIKACQLRGVKNAKVQDIMLLKGEKFDTILLLMNGTGICGKLADFSKFLQKLKSLLNTGGQILIDSTDLKYMYDVDDLNYLNENNIYYGELKFIISYKNKIEKPFDWLYLDFKTLKNNVLKNSLHVEKIIETEDFSYLARIS